VFKLLKRLICKIKGKHEEKFPVPVIGARNKFVCRICGNERFESVLPKPRKTKFTKEFII
jgi:hypothetical protein